MVEVPDTSGGAFDAHAAGRRGAAAQVEKTFGGIQLELRLIGAALKQVLAGNAVAAAIDLFVAFGADHRTQKE